MRGYSVAYREGWRLLMHPILVTYPLSDSRLGAIDTCSI